MIAVISFACSCLIKDVLICKQIVHNFQSLHHQKTVLKAWIKSNLQTNRISDQHIRNGNDKESFQR